MEQENNVTMKCGPKGSILVIGRPTADQFTSLCRELSNFGYGKIKEPEDSAASFQFEKGEAAPKKTLPPKRESSVVARLLKKSRNGTLTSEQIEAFSKLSPRTRRAWDLLLAHPAKQVAEEMGITMSTLSVYMYKVKTALLKAAK